MGLNSKNWLTIIIKYAILTLLVILFSSVAQGQAPLDEVEKLKIEVLNLKQRVADAEYKTATCQYQLNTVDVQLRIQSLKQAIEGTRPGFEYDIQNGVFKDARRERK